MMVELSPAISWQSPARYMLFTTDSRCTPCLKMSPVFNLVRLDPVAWYGTVHRCLQSKAPKYLTDCCTPVSNIASRRHLRSASLHHLSVPRHWLSTFGRQAFSVAGPTVWNFLPDSFRDPALSSSSLRQQLKTEFFNRYSAHAAQ